MPCRAAMPSALLLSKTYEGKAVTFLYISIDKDLNKWRNANKAEKLSHNSYVFTDVKNAACPRHIV
jgi:hypothetical protein